MKLYTCQMAQWRLATNLLDVTVKSGDKAFAPTWELLERYQSGKIDDKEYTEEFLELMRISFKVNRLHWREVLCKKELTIACYCPVGSFCHRRVLIDLFRRCCHYLRIPFEYMGEITKNGIITEGIELCCQT